MKKYCNDCIHFIPTTTNGNCAVGKSVGFGIHDCPDYEEEEKKVSKSTKNNPNAAATPVFSKEQKIILDKLDKLLCLRESKIEALKQLNRVIKQGIEKANSLPGRWYVRSPKKSVIKYLEKKYGKKLSDYKSMSIGYGELHNEFAFVPHDVDYSWEITQEEFDYALQLKELSQAKVSKQNKHFFCDHTLHTFFRISGKTRKCNGCGEIYENK